MKFKNCRKVNNRRACCKAHLLLKYEKLFSHSLYIRHAQSKISVFRELPNELFCKNEKYIRYPHHYGADIFI